jgi:hypothetical protein
MTLAAEFTSDFRMGRVIQRTFAVIGRNFWLMVAMAALTGLPLATLQWLALRNLQSRAPEAFPFANLGIFYAAGFLSSLGYCVLLALITRATLADLSGRRPSAADMLTTADHESLPVLAIGTLYVLGLLGGLLLLVLPAIIWGIMWSMAIPARVVEGARVGESFRRSRELTRGFRWHILGLGLIYYVLQSVFSLSVNVLTGAIPGPAPTVSLSSVTGGTQLLGMFLVWTVGAIAGSTAAASLYYELRVAKEGIGPEALAAVFD